jgi:2-C-methyl-D-erythritol 4-phosphate cytidylyltransferase
MASEQPKQFIPIGGRPILMRTLEAFHRWDAAASLIVVLPPEYRMYWSELCKSFACKIPHRVVPGGDTRFQSVRNGLKFVDGPGLVGVHDGVRPFVSSEVIEACFAQAARYGAAVPVLPVTDSLRELVPGGWKSRQADRSRFVTAQTPQVFWSKLLCDAYRQPYRREFTDDASVVEAMGVYVHTVEGNRENLKITSPSDLSLAEALLHISRSV